MKRRADQLGEPDGMPGPKAGAKDDLKSLPMPELQGKLGSSPDGLSQADAQKRLTQYGPNEIEEKKGNLFLKRFTYFWGRGDCRPAHRGGRDRCVGDAGHGQSEAGVRPLTYPEAGYSRDSPSAASDARTIELRGRGPSRLVDPVPTRGRRPLTIDPTPGVAALPTIALIGTYVPRACGIATFTRDLRDALLAAGPPTADGSPFVVALDHGGPHDPKTYPPEVRVRLRRGDPAGVARAEASLDAAGVGVVSLQLEYGIFGGPAGRRAARCSPSLLPCTRRW
jgi:hypothetical protein